MAAKPYYKQPTNQTTTQEVTEMQEPVITETQVEETVVQEPVVEEVVVTAPAPVVEAVKVQETVKVAEVEPFAVSDFMKGVELLQKEVGTTGKIVVSTILSYIENMQPGKPQSENGAIRNQIALYRAIIQCIENTGDDFTKVFTFLLAAFHEYRKTVFHEDKVFRHFDNITLGEEERQAFARLLNLLKVAADPSSRAQALKQITFETTLKHGLTEKGRHNVLAFFGK